MSRNKQWLSLVCLALCAVTPLARAQFAVIDVSSLAQLIAQARTLEQQLATVHDHLLQALAEFRSMTGGRGMERLLAGTVRNYLPTDWAALDTLLTNRSGSYGALATELDATIRGNAVLSTGQLTELAPTVQRQLTATRDSVALLQVMSHEALATTSARFASLQRLIDAIPGASDQKAILDLQARIGAEQGMLENEQTKLQLLLQSVQAEERASQQRGHELVVAGHGQFNSRFQATLP